MKNITNNHHVSAFRLKRHHLLPEPPASLDAICREVCGMQAQVMSAAEIAWWARNHALTREQIQTALWQTRALVKTFAMRGTLHIVTAEDLPIYCSALGTSQIAAHRRLLARLDITAKEAEHLHALTLEALRDRPRTQGELTEFVKPRVGKKVRDAIAIFWNIFRPAFFSGEICYGPSRGQEVTFVRTAQWLRPQKEIDETEARQILLRRYLRAYGPATVQDFSHWTGLAMREVKPVFAALAGETCEVEISGVKNFLLHEDLEQLHTNKTLSQSLRLLPSFDPFMLGHVDKSLLVDQKNYKRVYRNQGWLSHVLLLNGRVLGVWNYRRRTKPWNLEIAPFEKISKAVRTQILTEAESLGEFLGVSWEIKFLR